ncbi:MAG TPA: prepilin-type N-terminal cleavage/methylation domain-containing protein [Gemmatimonadales bacterium]|nr:prepilin-type N-terminal cleavage/methylation domain-containing protein [Gemmatimonadales bacterium]
MGLLPPGAHHPGGADSHHPLRSARGFTLVEIMMAVVIFSVVILSLVGLSYRVAKYSTRATDQALGMSALLAKVDRAATIPFDSLPTLVGCDTTQSGLYRVWGCTAVTILSPRLDSVQIIVTSTLPAARPDTVNMQRGKERRPVPLR